MSMQAATVHGVAVELELAPKQKRPAGERCCEPVAYPDVERDRAERMATLAKAIADPVRLQLVDVLRKHAGEVCVCELVPLFELSQPTINAGRSQISQALFERAAAGRHSADSAGTTPGERVHPEVVEAMRELDIDLTDRRPQTSS
jgi:ArsR family transcriptional regulator, arsenate/arsenite/antimonite-responsive transcriptional repressor